MISEAQKTIIRNSWKDINKQAAGNAFYAKLATHCPPVYAVFNLGSDLSGDPVAVQGLKVMNFVDLAVKNLHNMNFVETKLDELANLHINFGAKKAHFPLARSCFLNALKDTQGGVIFNADAMATWGVFYDFIAAHLSAPLS